jgi:transmembrane sensor
VSRPYSDPPETPMTAERVAAEWFGLKRSGAMSADDVRAFEVWLAREPENRAAYDNLEHYWLVAQAVRNDPQVLAMRDAAARAHPSSRRPALIWGGIAAALAVAVIGGLSVQRSLPAPPEPATLSARNETPAPGRQTFRTAVGQTTSVLLPDGSAVNLDTDTVLRTMLTGTERRLVLERGRAFFRVAKDKHRPFVVVAAGRTITATGTAFDVRADPKRFQVILVEGRVRVEEPRGKGMGLFPQVTEMTPGLQLVADADRSTVARADVPKTTSWLNGRLTFDNEPLSDVVAEINRYSDRKIVLNGAALGRTPILGVFKADDVDGFVRALQEYRLAKVSSETPEAITLTGM